VRSPAQLLACIFLTACLGGPDDSFPSLLPRPAEASRDLSIEARTPTGISREERADLRQDIDRAGRQVAEAEAAAEASGTDLDTALAGARGSAAGDPLWIEAQVALSRFESARSALADRRTAVSALLVRTGMLPPGDEDRLRAEAVAGALDAAERAATARTNAATALLPPPR
jgi:hypothetical protein